VQGQWGVKLLPKCPEAFTRWSIPPLPSFFKKYVTSTAGGGFVGRNQTGNVLQEIGQ
jgi:hypothetical protein